MRLVARCVLLFATTSSAWAVSGGDGVDLRLSKGPGAGDVSLQWTGGTSPFGVFRTANPVDPTLPANHLGGTSTSTWIDTPPAGALWFYYVGGACVYNPPELCDNLDNDCDTNTPDGSEDPELNKPCDGGDGDLCFEGVKQCLGGALTCSDATGTTNDLCDGADNDCDAASPDGSEDPQVGAACDGADGDLCVEGTRQCSGGSLTCSDATGTTNDLCDGIDNDCDAASADGSEDPQVGTSCDGTDGDLCLEGTRQCSNGVLTCSDATGTTSDICDGADNDCDAASPDGSEDPQVGAACDGADGDLCVEGTRQCSGGSLTCSDLTGTTNDLCDGIDNDCDAASADGSEDPQVGTSCDGADGDLCLEGTRGCAAGSLTCSDSTGTSVEACSGNNLDEDCDGAIDEGFPRDTNPSCATPFNLGTIAGDAGAPTATDSRSTEMWERFRLHESSSSMIYLSARIDLVSPPGSDFDLYVYCASCGGSVTSSTVGGLTGHTDTVFVRRNDPIFGGDDSIDVFIEVRYFNATYCGTWQLTVIGNVATNTTACN